MENNMKIKDLLDESPMLIPDSANDSKHAIKHEDAMKQHFENLITKNSEWEKQIKEFTLKRIENNYILIDESNILLYGLHFINFRDGISVKWMKNYSKVKGLTSLIFTEIIKYDDFCDVIYSGDTHTSSNYNLHKNAKFFKQLKVDVWDEKKKEITTEDPYSGIYSNKKQFRFKLIETLSKSDLEDENFNSPYLFENFEPTYENILHNFQFFVYAYFFDGVAFEKQE